MQKPRTNVLDGRPLLDIASYARQGAGRRDRFSPAAIAQISRTVRRVPEVMVKVLSNGSNHASAVAKHIGYIGRYGDLALETDEGEQMQSRDAGKKLLEGWDLDLDERRHSSELASVNGRSPPKLVHKLMLSMPAGTPPAAVFAAARNFLREEFTLQHRYAFVLHTDEPHPHVHAVVKAVSEQGERLHIKKATLRRWREEFARHLREQGVEANATERAVRGEIRPQMLDGIYRAHRRGVSTLIRERVEAVGAQLHRRNLQIEPGKMRLLQTRRDVERGWLAVADILIDRGHRDLAADARRFVEHMRWPLTQREQMIAKLLERARLPARDVPTAR